DRLAELDEHPFEVRDLGAHRADLLRVEPEACERLPHGLQEGRLPDRVVGVLREASDLRVLLRLEGLGPLGQDRIRAAHVGPLPFLSGRLPVRSAQGDLRSRVGARLAEAVPAFWARSGMSAYTPFRRASCACVRSFR